MDTRLIEIGKAIRDNVFRYVSDSPINLFLIGAKITTNPASESLRARLRPVLESGFEARVYYPEELFGDHIFGDKMDLLGLENLLAESVDALVICPESAGSLVELGAFVNHPKLCKRIIVIADSKHRRAQSFIKLGPLRFLQQKKFGKVLWFDYKAGALPGLSEDVFQAAKRIKGTGTVKHTLTNPIYLGYFLLVAVRALQPISLAGLSDLVQELNTPEGVTSDVIHAAINHLITKRAISLESDEYRITPQGMNMIQSILVRHTWTRVNKRLDSIRVEVLNLYYRRKYKLEGRAVRS